MQGATFLRTTDGGTTWTKATAPPEATRVADLFFIDDDRGWAVGTSPAPNGNDKTGSGGLVLATRDGGRTWGLLQRFPPDVAGGLRRVSFVDASHGWALGQTAAGVPAALATTDGGVSWRTVSLPEELREARDLVFLDESHGWILGEVAVPLDGGVVQSVTLILATADGGATWSEQSRTPDTVMWDLDFLDANRGWAIGNVMGAGRLLTTTDGGVNWTLSTVPGRSLTTVAFVDDTHGWAGGMQGACIYVTTDGGRSWEGRSPDKPGPCSS
jgi:photosystem II stability/assembly factor-like uncharacterized protein